MKDILEILAAIGILISASMAGLILILIVNPAFWVFITIVIVLNALLP